MKIVGMDVGSTTVKAVLVEDDRVVWRDYQRHHTRQAEKVLEFLKQDSLASDRYSGDNNKLDIPPVAFDSPERS